MPHKTFFWFVLPSVSAMLVFIVLPIISTVIQSLYVSHEQVLIEVENCTPFGCESEISVDHDATAELRAEQPLGKFNALGTYADRNHLAISELGESVGQGGGVGALADQLGNLPFYGALFFTLTYVAVVTPLVMVLGFGIAVAVNSLDTRIKAVAIFLSLLPLVITPLIGSLILFWMVDARGIIGATLQYLMDDPNLSLKASPTLTWIMLMVYGVWHSAPFAFIVFYAGLQTVPQDTLDSAMIDGANRWQRIRYVVLPHLAPLVTFVALIQLMDNFRVFEPIVGFNAEASATSLSWMIYNDLDAEPSLFGSAAATSVLTILGAVILLTPVLVRTWRDFRRAK